MTDTLLDLINRLTKPYNVDIDDHGRHLGTRTDPALLEQLSNARASSVSPGNDNGSNARHTRTSLNLAASELFGSIQKRVRGWALAADIPRHWASGAGPTDWREPIQLLPAWYARVLGDSRFVPAPYIDTLQSWTRSIESLLNPPRRWTLAAPCPLCNTRWILDPDGLQIDSLGVVESDTAEPVTVCRNCEAVWPGLMGARELRMAIDERAEQVSA